ncbi:unnamed protein product, partial [marine sediment metagenome]
MAEEVEKRIDKKNKIDDIQLILQIIQVLRSGKSLLFRTHNQDINSDLDFIHIENDMINLRKSIRKINHKLDRLIKPHDKDRYKIYLRSRSNLLRDLLEIKQDVYYKKNILINNLYNPNKYDTKLLLEKYFKKYPE